MSLINDALKRARETQRNQPPPGAPPLQPVETAGRGGAGWMLVVAAILFVAAVGFILGPARFGHKTPASVAVKSTAIPVLPPAEAAPATGTTPPVANTKSPAAAQTNPPPVAAPAKPRLKVQGIIFNSVRPLAIVNGQTVNVGDRVGDFQVKQITQTSVLFQHPDGTQKTLGIGD
jgi:hypothetical protein